MAMTQADLGSVGGLIPEVQPQTESMTKELQKLWDKSVAAYDAEQAETLAQARFQYHSGQAVRLRKTLGALVEYHEAEAQRYLGEG